MDGMTNGGVQLTSQITLTKAASPASSLPLKGDEKVTPRPSLLTTRSEPIVKGSQRRKYIYKARESLLDRQYMYKTEDSLRGFFTLFWITISFYIVLTFVHNFEKDGSILHTTFFELFSKDALGLIWSDIFMVLFTFFSVPFAKLGVWGWMKYHWFGMVLQHVCQCMFVGLNVYWTFLRDWPWVQAGSFTLHTIAMVMKCHSYTTHNGELSIIYHRHNALKKRRDEILGLEKKEEGEDGAHAEELARLEEEMSNLKEELTTGKTTYPDNVTFRNFLDFLMIPSLVYELEYPRTDSIRIQYILEKTVATFGTFLVLYTTTEHYILPTLFNPDIPNWRVILELLFPFMINYLLIFYIIFECICNWFAEISMFADRNFYDDWWNSTTYDSFARKWNKPVHHFLLRHVYSPTLTSNLGPNPRETATMFTFLLSSCIHELVMIVVSKKIRMYLFVLQMLQIPLIWLGRIPSVKANPTLGNAVFWFGMFVGPPMLGILYCREAFSAVRAGLT